MKQYIPCIGYFSVAVIKHHDQGNLQKRKLMSACSPSVVESMMVERARLEAGDVKQNAYITDHPCGICPSAGLYSLDLPKQCH